MKTTVIKKVKKFTEKQKKFCLEYLRDFNGTAAAIRAGYSANSAYSIAEENLKKPEIKAYINELKNKRNQRAEIDIDKVLNYIIEVTLRCMQKRPVLDKQGRPVMVQTPNGLVGGVYQFDPVGAMRGLELLSKHVGLGNKEIQDQVQQTLNIVVSNFTKDDPRYNNYFPVTPETEHIAELMGIEKKFRPKKGYENNLTNRDT